MSTESKKGWVSGPTPDWYAEFIESVIKNLPTSNAALLDLQARITEALGVTRQLWKSHRVIGYEVARATTEAGMELVILETAEHRREVAPAHMLMPVDEAEIVFDVQVQFIKAIEAARFLGLSDDAIRAAFAVAMPEKESNP